MGADTDFGSFTFFDMPPHLFDPYLFQFSAFL